MSRDTSSRLLRVRRAVPADVRALARIYNEGIEDRVATFETRLRTPEEVAPWLEGRHPVVVAEEEEGVVAFAAASAYRPRACYAGVAECSVYVARKARGRGAGRAVLEALVAEAEAAGFWKLLSRIFVENAASRRMVQRAGFREVGTYVRHAQLDGVWRDVVIVERLLGTEALTSRPRAGHHHERLDVSESVHGQDLTRSIDACAAQVSCTLPPTARGALA